MADFASMSVDGLAAFIEDNRAELAADGVSRADVKTALDQGRAVLETRPHAFAVVEVKRSDSGGLIPHLWLLYVDPSQRGHGLGRAFVRDLLNKYATDYHMSLWCSGAQRRKFFGRLGFVVESRDGDMRRMTTNREHYR